MITFSPDSLAARAELGFGEQDMEVTAEMQRAGLAVFEEWRAAPLGVGHGEVVGRILSAAIDAAPTFAPALPPPADNEHVAEGASPFVTDPETAQAIETAGATAPIADQATVDDALVLLSQDGASEPTAPEPGEA